MNTVSLTEFGLTKREYFAAQIMIMAIPAKEECGTWSEIAADALIAALNT